MKPATVLDPVVGVAKLPFKTMAWTYGVLRGVAAGVIRVASGEQERAESEPDNAFSSEPAAAAPVVEEHRRDPEPEQPVQLTLVEPAEERAPEPVKESFINEPTAVSRASAHGGGGRDADIDDWYGEIDGDDDLPNSVVEALEMNDGVGPLVDESAIKATLSEAQVLRGIADQD